MRCYDGPVSVWRTCRGLALNPKSYHYISHRRDQVALGLHIREICETHIRYD
ncbi:MAG: hypothetical protein H6846_00035 [Hyphomonas sp.]|nr:hypothetical protein [Hyphomonas sp.]